MATLRFRIEAGRIAGYEGRYFERISEDGLKAVGNGWEVTIRPASKKRPGRIIAHCERMYSDGPAICHREFRLEDGTLGLAGGNVYSRYAYFRTAEFQRFLDEFGITAVKREDPNQTFTSFSAYTGRGSASQQVESDGQVNSSYEDEPGSREYFERPGNNPNLYEGRDIAVVSGATWAIVETKEDYGDNHNFSRILYSLTKDVTSLAPELRRRKNREAIIGKLRKALDVPGSFSSKKFDTMSELRQVVEPIIEQELPRTLAEQSGEVKREFGYNWMKHSFNGIPFELRHPKDIEGRVFETLDELAAVIRVPISYSACVWKERELVVLANDREVGSLQL